MGLNDFGYTRWGKDWVRLAESLHQTRPEPQLPRARGLALDGRVQVTISRCDIRGFVRHGRKNWEVNLEVVPLSPHARAGITDLLTGQSAITDELHRAIAKAGHSTAPMLARATCPCSADSSRCAHILAVYYEMSRQVDDDPRISLSVQDCFQQNPNDAASNDAETSPAVIPQRWIAVDGLSPHSYFAIPDHKTR